MLELLDLMSDQYNLNVDLKHIIFMDGMKA